MADLLIRNVPDQVIATIDAIAKRLGLSRTEYLRRQLTQATASSGGSVDPEHLRTFANAFSDLADPEVMSQAWQ